MYRLIVLVKIFILIFLVGISFLGVMETFALYKIKIQDVRWQRVVRLGTLLGCLILGVLVINYFT